MKTMMNSDSFLMKVCMLHGIIGAKTCQILVAFMALIETKKLESSMMRAAMTGWRRPRAAMVMPMVL